jgi:hypothetical protein
MLTAIIQGQASIDPDGGTVDAPYRVVFVPNPTFEHPPCEKLGKGYCFSKVFTASDLLNDIPEAHLWMKYTPREQLAGKSFKCALLKSVHDRLVGPV